MMGAIDVILRVDGATPSAASLLKMAAAAPHRGRNPTTYITGRIAMAHQANAAALEEPQPYVVDSGRLAVVLSGRLYNREEVARKVEQAGHPVRDRSHCGTIAAAYDAWGDDCVRELDGDFAFTLYDSLNNRLLGARDAFGVKPLCYSHWNGALWIASEPRQILAAGVPSTPCEESIVSYIALERSLLDAGLSFHKEIRRLKPGHLIVQEGSGAPREIRYWRIDPHRVNEEKTEADMAARVREMLIQSVRRRAPEKGPYGCELSGGFDSSTVAGLLRRDLKRRGIDDPMETFSFELRDNAADEPELIDAVAKDVGANHHHIYVDKDNVFELLPHMLQAGGQPQFDMGLLYLWRCKEETARHGVHVTMSGLGGDELFFGRYQFLADLLKKGRFIELSREVASLFPYDRSTGKKTSLKKLAAAYIASPLMSRGVRAWLRRRQGRGDYPAWITPGLAQRTNLAARIAAGPPQVFNDYYRQDCLEVFESIMINMTVPIHEALGATFNVDTRFPLLDRELVEYLFAAPREYKIRGGQTRMLQRRAMEGILPPVVTQEHLKKNLNPVLWRQQNAHFARTLEKFFKQRSFRIGEYIDIDWLRRAYDDFVSGRGSGQEAYVLWYALNIESWLQLLETQREVQHDGIPAA
ncbi:asparagine synthetase B family protein [Microvirga terrestris]|nr:asparagine synthase-related protein [Microvirga terrestris]